MTTAEALQTARGLYFRAPSHATADDFPRPGRRCVLMAIEEAVRTDRSGQSERTFNEAVAAFGAAAGTEDVVGFNAEHSTEEVLATFSAAVRGAA